jgi:hypothetical protein
MHVPMSGAPPLVLDLTSVAKDATLRRVTLGPGGEPLEVSLLVMRRHLGPRESEKDRLYGLRFRGLRGVAAEALRWDRDDGRWVSARADWVGALEKREMEPPIIGAAAFGAPEALERLDKAAETLVWRAGTPDAIAAGERPMRAAPFFFEATGEAILPSGENANVRLIVAADELEVIGSRGKLGLDDLLRFAETWAQKWRDYWHRKGWKPELDDPQFEWCAPEKDDRD